MSESSITFSRISLQTMISEDDIFLMWMDFNWISDIDECNDASLNQCTFPNLCVNVDGSYNCLCPDYHVLENDGRTCKG